MTVTRAIALLLLTTAVLTPIHSQPRGEAGWDEREAKVVERLDKSDWAAARKQVRRLLNDVQEEAWELPGVARRLARLGRYLAIAEINLAMDRAAVWHWLSAWNLAVPSDLELFASYDRADVLLEYTLRSLGEMPPGFAPLHDLEILRLEPAVLDPTERPVLANDTARRDHPVTDLQLELLIDRAGRLLHPVVHDTGVPAVAVWATLDWMLTFPAARPATLDGEPVDALQPVTVTFSQDNKPGFVFER